MDIEVIVTCVWCTETKTRIISTGDLSAPRFCGVECQRAAYQARRRAGETRYDPVERTFECGNCGVTVTRTVHSTLTVLFCETRCEMRARNRRNRRLRRRRQSLAKRNCEGCGDRRALKDQGGGLVICDDCFIRLHGSCFRKYSQALDRAASVAHQLGGSIYPCPVCQYWHRTSAPTPRPEIGVLVGRIVNNLVAPGAQFAGRPAAALRSLYLSSLNDGP